jgi:hypothetical protein
MFLNKGCDSICTKKEMNDEKSAIDLEARDDELDAADNDFEHVPLPAAPRSRISLFGGTGLEYRQSEEERVFTSADDVARIRSGMGTPSKTKKKRRYPDETDPDDSDFESLGPGSGSESDGPAARFAGFTIGGGGESSERKSKRAKPSSHSTFGGARAGRPQQPPPRPAQSLAEEIEHLQHLASSPLPGFVPDAPPAFGFPGGGEEPMKSRAFDWSRLEAEEPEKNPNPDWCALCKVSQRSVDATPQNPFLADLIKDAEDNWAHRSEEETGTELQIQYNREIRPYIQPESMRLPCHKRMFWIHFVEHCSNVRIQWEIALKGTNEMIRTLQEQQLFVRNPSTGAKNVTSNMKTVGMYFKCVQQADKITTRIQVLRPKNVL